MKLCIFQKIGGKNWFGLFYIGVCYSNTEYAKDTDDITGYDFR